MRTHKIRYVITQPLIISALAACSNGEFYGGSGSTAKPTSGSANAAHSNYGKNPPVQDQEASSQEATSSVLPATVQDQTFPCQKSAPSEMPLSSVFGSVRSAPSDKQTAVLSSNNKQNNISLSADFLTATTSTQSDTVLGTVGKSSDKWYFEVFVARLNPCNHNSIGIGSLEGASSFKFEVQMGGFPFSIGYNPWGEIIVQGVNNAPANSGRINSQGGYKSGDVIGIAADFTTHQVLVSLNGIWRPSAAPITGGPKIFETSNLYYPAINLSTGDTMIANFGEKQFKYGPPAGFNAGWY